MRQSLGSARRAESASRPSTDGSAFRAKGDTRASEPFGMMELDQAKQLKELQKENARLKRMLADEMLGKELLKEALEKKW